MATETRKRSFPPLAFVLDLLEYHLRPRLRDSGGDLWLEELLANSLVMGFRAGKLGRDGTRDWLLQEIRLMVPESADGVALKDYTS